MTLPKVVSERLMFLSSSMCLACISSSLLTFSEPARSPKLSLDLFKFPCLSTYSVSMRSWKRECDLLEFMFILVALFILFLSPLFRSIIQSFSFSITYSDRPSTYMPWYLSSLIYSGFLLCTSWNKSYSFSLYICKKEQYTVTLSACFCICLNKSPIHLGISPFFSGAINWVCELKCVDALVKFCIYLRFK